MCRLERKISGFWQPSKSGLHRPGTVKEIGLYR